jgi:hypothetical protein
MTTKDTFTPSIGMHCMRSWRKFMCKMRFLQNNYTKYDIYRLIVFSVVTTLSCSTLNFNSLIISVTHKCATTYPTTMSLLLLSLLISCHIIRITHKCATTFPTTMSLLFLSLLIFFHILTNSKFVHVTSTYYHS